MIAQPLRLLRSMSVEKSSRDRESRSSLRHEQRVGLAAFDHGERLGQSRPVERLGGEARVLDGAHESPPALRSRPRRSRHVAPSSPRPESACSAVDTRT